MKCIICHTEDITLAEAKEEIKIGNDIVYVPITVLTCNSCGEKYYNRKTMVYLEQVKTKIKSNQSALKQIGKVLVYK